jgi:RimJ/RimL family protein N-acetyltransferase
LAQLTAEVDPRNAASLRLLAKLGFRETHRAVRTLLWKDEWCDSIYLARPRQQ